MSEQSTFEKVKAITVDQLSVAPEDVKNGLYFHR